ncbi:uncharacterized protein [Pseudorasbora parva]|uniref:uncharacterized protein n=1 Tax=Pseudorasbora parva TaxID=51549 RepID=UPI00351E3EC7
MSSRRCCFHPGVKSPLFGLPTDAARRDQWLQFMFNSLPEKYDPNLKLCAAHFTEDSFLNLNQYNAGFALRLFLKPDAVPSLSGEGVVYGPQSGQSSQKLPATSSICEAGCQTDSTHTETVATQTKPKKRSVATQLSVGTLRGFRVRSKGTQTTTPMLPDDQLSSSPERDSIFRPSKRLRLEEDEEERAEAEIYVELHDSIFHPESVPQESEFTTDPVSSYSDKKFIVFESCLREIFETCPVCKAKCDVHQRQIDTFVAFTQLCGKCQHYRRWQSQPVVGSTPLGNLQLCAAIYFLVGSFSKLQKIFQAMQLQTVQYGTFRRHARNFFEPTIVHKWNRDQQHVISQLKKRGKRAIAGDMRADSPGHSAKFGSYTLMDVETNSIVDLQLIQSNEVGGGSQMEKEGLKRCLDKLDSCGLAVEYMVTDRRPQIRKYLRERHITQYYDVWHFEKALTKKLRKLSQSKDSELLKKWLKSIKNHLYWSATSSVSGPEKVAKWTSLLNHMQNIHVHDNPRFPKCEHQDKTSRNSKKWFGKGSVTLRKVEKIMCNKRVLKDFEKLSQTSTLEAFHRLLTRFAPKNLAFFPIGMLCRLYLAAMHHNENNAHRPQATTRQAFPKSKKGEYTAVPVKTDPTFDYVDDLMSLLLHKVLVDPTPYVEELHQIPIPPII